MEYEDEIISETISGKFEIGLDLEITFVDTDTYLVNSGIVKFLYEKFLLSSLFGQSLCVDIVCYDLSFAILLYVLTNRVFFF